MELEKYLTIDKGSLDNELIHQSSLFFQVGEAYVAAVDKRDALKEALAVVEAELENEIRETAERRKEKVTNDEVKSLVKASGDRLAAYTAYSKSKRDADRLAVLKDAFMQRASMLKHLCELYIANYYEQNSVRGTARQDTAAYIQTRNKIAEHRRNGKQGA